MRPRQFRTYSTNADATDAIDNAFVAPDTPFLCAHAVAQHSGPLDVTTDTILLECFDYLSCGSHSKTEMGARRHWLRNCQSFAFHSQVNDCVTFSSLLSL